MDSILNLGDGLPLFVLEKYATTQKLSVFEDVEVRWSGRTPNTRLLD
jgi:hypothetical protein